MDERTNTTTKPITNQYYDTNTRLNAMDGIK